MPSEQTQFWKFQNSIGGNNEATLYIYGDIMQYDLEWWNWPDDVIPHRFRQELDALGDVSRIHVRINSNGGSVFGAYSIMNLLKSHKAEIITYNDGIAASAATLIAMAGDRVVTALGAAWMIHLPATEARGNVKVFQKAIEILTTIKDTMLDVYHAKTGIDKAELENMLNEDTWLTGTEAKAKGFADEVADSVVEAVLDANNSTAVFNGLPVSLAGIPGKIVAMLEKPAAKQAKPVVAVQNKPATMGFEINVDQTNEEEIMTLEDLKAKHPEIYDAAIKAGIAAGVKAERERIKDIDAMALPGMDDLTNQAKYDTGITAGEFAIAMVKAQKQKGANYQSLASKDAAELDGVMPDPGVMTDDDQETAALLAYAVELAEKGV